ncbi:MAG: type IV toxin-antitoxin system AbiEi family antitoxin domain-containing protein [Propionibacteriaceae bacterium]|jgi:hypothetical protein|nr:type IV toxin-antitoxin system AbiEi family antitoxin domain-containing protein [Propionibacteriaceae bacterium]
MRKPKAAILDALLQEQNGFLKTSDAIKNGISKTYFRDFAEKRSLIRIAHGIYMSQDAWDDGMYVIQARYPEIIFSHETALYLLKIADREPTSYSITMRAGKNAMGLTRQGIRVYKIRDPLFEEGLTVACTPAGNAVRVYNAERTICDLFRSRRNIEIQTLQSAVREYLGSEDKNIPLLLRYAKALSVEKIVCGYLEVLL